MTAIAVATELSSGVKGVSVIDTSFPAGRKSW